MAAIRVEAWSPTVGNWQLVEAKSVEYFSFGCRKVPAFRAISISCQSLDSSRAAGHAAFSSTPLSALSDSVSATASSALSVTPGSNRGRHIPSQASAAEAAVGGSDGGSDDGGAGDKGHGGGGGGGEGGGEASGDSEKNKAEALAALAAIGRSLEGLPADLAAAIQDGRITGAIVKRFAELEKSPLFRYLLQFGGFKERLLADDLFLTKVGIECGVGLFTKTGAEYERRREKFFGELDFVVADVIMALIADFMLVWLPAPTVGLGGALSKNAGKLATFFYNCPDNAFQVAIRGVNYSLLQRLGAIVRNGGKLLAVGTTASLFGTAATNGLIALRKSVGPKGEAAGEEKAAAAEEHKVPILATSLAYGVYMAVSSNLRYQLLAGVVEQRVLEPILHDKKLALSVLSFVARTANTFLGSLLWVDYARFVGVQSSE